MRILGIDYGDARTGLSISDPSEFLAGSPSVIHEWNYDKLVEKLVAFIEQNKIGEIVLGHPLSKTLKTFFIFLIFFLLFFTLSFLTIWITSRVFIA